MLEQTLIAKTLRVPAANGNPGDGTVLARQFDAALMSVGFKATGDLLAHISGLDPDTGLDVVVGAIAAVRRLVGDHVEHNVYFRDFPHNVPETLEFWAGLLSKALVDAGGSAVTAVPLLLGGINLLELPGYGSYQHTYTDMLAAHETFIPALGDRVTLLHLGAGLEQEAAAVYLDLAASRTPLAAHDLELLETLAAFCADAELPEAIPVRENKAIINRVRLAHGRELLADTVTDVLRLAAAVSGGDVTLETPTRLVSLARRDRRALLAALDAVATDTAKLADVNVRAEQFKRLGERLHPHEYAHAYPHAAAVFAVARGEQRAPSLAARTESAFEAGDVTGALRLLANAPGMLLRTVDRAARAMPASDWNSLYERVATAAERGSGRVLLSLREHLANRYEPAPDGSFRIFVGRSGRGHATAETRPPLPVELVAELARILDEAIAGRLPHVEHLVIDPAVYRAAIPLSGKNLAPGLQIMPRGSRTAVTGERLRFFVHWQQRAQRTDFDLSALLLGEHFENLGHLSYTNLTLAGGSHSGDITSAPAPHGGSEFIEFETARIEARYILPQVNVFTGEGFDEVEEGFFGYMSLDAHQKGKPFEPRAVRMKADLRGAGRIALPLAFERQPDGGWDAVWMNLNGRGLTHGNAVENNRVSTAMLARGIVRRRYLAMAYLIEALRAKAGHCSEWCEELQLTGPVTYIGMGRPENLPEGSDVYGLDRWNQLVPA